MTSWIGNFKIETGFGFDINNATVTEILERDEFGRVSKGSVVFVGTWSECIAFAESHYPMINCVL